MKTALLGLLGILLLCPGTARSQSQERRINDGFGRLLQADQRSVDQELGARIASPELRREVSAILDLFRPRDAGLRQKTAGTEQPAATQTVSFSAFNAHMSASALQNLRLNLHAAMMAAAKKYGLTSCPFHK